MSCRTVAPASHRRTALKRSLLSEETGANGADTPSAEPLGKARLDMIEACGRVCQLLGLPRSTGQIYGLLLLASKPLSLDDIAQLLGISKGSASMGTRQLLTWHAIRQVWVMGKRRDHFQVEPDFGNLFKSSYSDFLKPRLESTQKRLESMTVLLEEDLKGHQIDREGYELCEQRLQSLRKFEKRLRTLLPLAEKLF